MKERNIFCRWCFYGIISICMIIVSYHYLDKPIVYYFHTHSLYNYKSLKLIAEISDIFLHLCPFTFFFLIIKQSLFENKSYYTKKNHNKLFILIAGISIGFITKEILKIIFARYWADTFRDNNLSLLKHQVYGFAWFKKGTTYQSFPSGHVLISFVVAVILQLFYPRYKLLLLLVATSVMITQVILYYHYLSDAIAGAYLGSFIGYYTYVILTKKV